MNATKQLLCTTLKEHVRGKTKREMKGKETENGNAQLFSSHVKMLAFLNSFSDYFTMLCGQMNWNKTKSLCICYLWTYNDICVDIII